MIYGLLIINDNGGRPWLNLKIYELSVWKQQHREPTQVSVASPRGCMFVNAKINELARPSSQARDDHCRLSVSRFWVHRIGLRRPTKSRWSALAS